MNSRGVKQLLFGLAILLFGLVLVFAAIAFLLLDAAVYLINVGHPIGQRETVIVWVALLAGGAGLLVALAGFGRND